MSEQNNPPTPESVLPDKLYCVNHPQRETYLRCNRCEKPICIQCAVLTPTGYRCKDCIRGIQKVYDTTAKVYETATRLDVILAGAAAALVAFGGSYIAEVMGFFTIFIAPLVGIIIEELVGVLTRHRRARSLNWAMVIGAGVGSLVLLVFSLTMLLDGTPIGSTYYTRLLWLGLYAVLMVSSLYYRLLAKR